MKRLLIGGSSSKLFHLKEFADVLGNFGVECKIVFDAQIYDGFPSRKIKNWFQTHSKFNELISEFKPDAIFVDRQRHFGLAATKTHTPLIVHLRGDYWKEMKMAKETLYKSPPKRLALWKWDQIGERCFQNANLILPICRHLENIVIERYPTKNVATLYQGITPSRWYHVEGMNLNHPCVGLLQGAVIFEKAKEMLILEKVLIALPHVTFYWVGDGPYREYVLSSLKKYDNFKWLGSLQYPDKVREYLSEIDIYALVTGIDMSPLTLLEAQLMEKPVVATNVGGVSELMKDGETGFLVEKGNHQQLIDKIIILLEDTKKAKEIGNAGRKFVANNFSWEIIGKKFLETTKKYLSL